MTSIYFPEAQPEVTSIAESSAHKEQVATIKEILRSEKLIDNSRVDPEVDWFYGKLGMVNDYFASNPPQVIAKHILSLYAAKMVAHATGNKLDVRLQNIGEETATFITSSYPGAKDSPVIAVEHYIEKYLLGEGYDSKVDTHSIVSSNTPSIATTPFRISCFRTIGTLSAHTNLQLRIHLCTKPKFPAGSVDPNETDINKIADTSFLSIASEHTKNLYQEVISEAVKKNSPAIRVEIKEKNFQSGETFPVIRLVIAYRRGTTHSYWSAVSDLYHFYGLYTVHKYVEQFANGIQLFTLYLRAVKDDEDLKDKAFIIAEQALSLAYVLPRTALSPLFQQNKLSLQEVCYAYVGWKFAFQFLSRYGNEYSALTQALAADPAKQALLDSLRSKLAKDAFTEERIFNAINNNIDLIKRLYEDFAGFHMPVQAEGEKAKSKYALTDKPGYEQDLLASINKLGNELDSQVLATFFAFNRSVLKTNFYKKGKTALSFRLNASYLDKTQYPNQPYAIFFLVGSEFRGFHVRFREIARGGIRMIKSVNATVYDHNALSLFDENYNLASTQQSKNKDIPEGGSKGTILLALDHQHKAEVAFRKYIDALLDLITPQSKEYIQEIVDHYDKEEILFLGPDEGTADYMDWASQFAKTRGYPFWKSFTTGKSTKYGGIPHDLYGMTTRSIHQFVLGTLEKLGLKEEECTKFQTGGPDGDLGSNEIKISKDKTIAIVDGSGVLYDPEGINRTDLLALATKRIMARNFDKSKLSPKGFFVDVEDKDITLPDGTVVESGLAFRNNFHLNPLSSATYFVPCGGRPESVGVTNVNKLFEAISLATGGTEVVPRYRFIVEGANLFFSQKARLILEDKGVIIFKDASANKGGVTSSSLEVLAALALNDEEFNEHMCVRDNKSPPFYDNYVAGVHKVIEDNARAEFECIWVEAEKSKTPKSILTDLLSTKINNLNDQIRVSSLWNNKKLVEKVLRKAIPKALIDLLGLSKIIERVPDNYLRAIFGAYLASRYVYTTGLNAPEFAFFTFIEDFLAEPLN